MTASSRSTDFAAARHLLICVGVSELVNEVLERTIDEADHDARQRMEAEADMANVLQWISCLQPGSRDADANTLAPAWMNA
ncbi:MAG: hypothetical protein WB973_12170 [Thermoanaerobaculia bacterium]